MATDGERLDVALVRRGLARSRGQARELIESGSVLIGGSPVAKLARRVGDTDVVSLGNGGRDQVAWVGRAAHKLVAALDAFGPLGLDVTSRSCLDVGASTGGFTQALLSRGAASVVAVDVGHGQLAPDVRLDPRVREVSGLNIRDAHAHTLGGPFDVVVSDLSFISLRLVIPVIADMIAGGGDGVLLIKPQFEVGRERLGKNGLVKEPEERAAAVLGVCGAARAAGLTLHGLIGSPITGSTGNHEYLLWVGRPPGNARASVLSPSGLERRIHELLREESLR